MNLAWWQILLGAIVGLIILTILVVLHELGHAVVAKRNHVEVEEFGIGFPPRAKVFGRVKGTRVSLNWLPLGGFCKMKGESDDATGSGTYGEASLWAKTKILLAGVAMNFLASCAIFTILAFWGIPKITANQFAIKADNHGSKGIVSIAGVVEGSAADRAGLKSGDIIKTVAGQEIELSTEVPQLTKAHAGQTIEIVVDHEGKPKSTKATIDSQDNGRGRLGITTEQKQAGSIKATWSAPLVGVVNTLQFFWLTICGLANIIGNLGQGVFDLIIGVPTSTAELSEASSGVSGPVGILGQIFPSAMMAGPLMLLYVSGIISISLVVMNLLPIPGLDGGRLYLTLWYRLQHKKLTKEREERLVGRGMMFIFGLVILITLLDVCKVIR